MSKKKEQSSGKDEPARIASPFAGLAGLREALPAGPQPARPAAQPREPSGPARAVVRMERKGRGGKEATCIEKLGLGADDLARWCSELKKALGCGGSVEDDVIVLHGDLRKRLEPLLLARGVRKVTLG
jgi:translation initiation factor 1